MRRTIVLALVALILVGTAAFFAFILSPGGGADGTTNGRGGGIFATLFPFGGEDQNNTGEDNSGGDLVNNNDTRPVPIFREVSSEPTSGGYLYKGEDGSTMIRYVDRATGHVFETSAKNLTVTRVSNTTIPAIQEVLFGDQNNFIIRYLNENGLPENFYVKLLDNVEDQSIQGDFVRAWERGVVSPDGKTIVAVDETTNGSTVYLSSLDGSSERAILSSPIRSWVPLTASVGTYVYTAPSPATGGFLYRVAGGVLTKIIGDIPGLVALVSPSGRYVLYSGGPPGNDLALYDTSTNEVYSGLFHTLANKCAFVSETPAQIVCGVSNEYPKAQYPNDWLLGKVALNDDIWLIEPVAGVGTLLAVPEDDVNRQIDVWQPMIDETGSYFGFINKNDLSFWTLQLKEPEPEAASSEEGGE